MQCSMWRIGSSTWMMRGGSEQRAKETQEKDNDILPVANRQECTEVPFFSFFWVTRDFVMPLFLFSDFVCLLLIIIFKHFQAFLNTIQEQAVKFIIEFSYFGFLIFG